MTIRLSRRSLLGRGLAVGVGALASATGATLLGFGGGTALGAPVTLENANLLISIDSATGALLRIFNKVKSLELIDTGYVQPSPAVPWKIETTAGSAESSWLTPTGAGASFSYAQSSTSLTLTWTCTNGMTVTAIITLNAGDTDAAFAVSVVNTGTAQIHIIEYPVIRGIKRLSGAAAPDYLLHPFATGFQFKNPYDLFSAGNGIPESPYPEGFNGAPTQVMAYYGNGVGGFYWASDDETGWVKWFDFFKNSSDGYLEARFLHSASGITSGNDLSLPYVIKLGVLTQGTWYEAADRYRAWAETSAFSQRGPLHSRPDRATWLLENVGFAVFGLNTQYDRTAWLQALHNIANKPVLHITGPNWQFGRWDYLGNQNAGQDYAVPAAFHSSYVSTLDLQGDKYAAFAFATMFNPALGTDATDATSAMQQIPGRDTPGQTNLLSRDAYGFKLMCPVPDIQERLSTFRDAKVVKDNGADAIYWDIGPNNIMLRCLAANHGHPVGGGAALTQAYRRIMAEVRAATAAAGAAYIPLGCEMVNEVFIQEMDFYQARAEASPASSFEAYSFWNWIKTGDCEKVPLFAYVYHEYGPIRLDGWGHLAAEQGDLFYWIASRVFAWGGIYELNYEFTSLEMVGASRDDITQHYSAFEVDRYYAIDASYQSFVQEIANARTGFANPYVAYGRMLRPLAYNSPAPGTISLPWFHYNAPPDSQEYEASGSLTVASVVESAWRYKTEKCGFVFVNLRSTSQSINVTIDPNAYGLTQTTGLHVFEVTTIGSTDRGAISAPTAYSVTLQPRKVTMLELRLP